MNGKRLFYSLVAVSSLFSGCAHKNALYVNKDISQNDHCYAAVESIEDYYANVLSKRDDDLKNIYDQYEIDYNKLYYTFEDFKHSLPRLPNGGYFRLNKLLQDNKNPYKCRVTLEYIHSEDKFLIIIENWVLVEGTWKHKSVINQGPLPHL